MLDKNLLLIDIGGTNIRYAYSNIGDSGFVSENKAELDSLNDFDNLMSVLLAESDVKHIVFSVAGPKVNNSIKMTNRKMIGSQLDIVLEHSLKMILIILKTVSLLMILF